MIDNNINRIKLPDLLLEDEFTYHYIQFKNGDFKSLELLIMHNLKLVYWYIDNYVNCNINDYDDIFSIGVEALIETIYNYDIDKNAKFSTYAIRGIRDKI